MTPQFTYQQIQNITCKLCNINGGECLFGEEKKQQLFNEKIPCGPAEYDENGQLTEEYAEILETCRYLYTPSNSEREDYFVVDENYYNSLKK